MFPWNATRIISICSSRNSGFEDVNAVKTITSREIQRKFPGVRKVLWKGKMWSPSYFLATSGQVTLPVLMKYVESQEDKRIEGV